MPRSFPYDAPRDDDKKSVSAPLKSIFRLLALLLLSSAILFGIYAWYLVKSAISNQLLHLSDFTARSSEQVLNHYASGQYLLGKEIQAHPEDTRALISNFQQSNPGLATVNIVKPDGQVLFSSAQPPGEKLPNVRNKPAFWPEIQRAMAAPGLTIGRPVYGILLKHWVIPLRYAVRDGSGKVLFILSANLLLEHQQSIWRYLNLPPQAAIGLIRKDGYLQSRWPSPENLQAVYGTVKHHPFCHPPTAKVPARQGTFMGKTDVDRELRLGAYSHLPHYPLTAFVSIPLLNVWASWAKVVLIPYLLLAFFAGGGFLMYRWALREQAAAESIRRQGEEKLQYLANHDSLTGLPNRILFEDRLIQCMRRAQRHEQLLAVLFLDLDHFKDINDTFGHHTGDQLLQMVAQRLTQTLRDCDTIARLGGDEFTVIVEDVNQVEHAALCGQRILDAFHAPFPLQDRDVFITVSIGVVFYPFEDGDTLESLLQIADMAMYRAKTLGRNNYQFHMAADTRGGVRLEMENHLHRALERRELMLYYQPKIDLGTGNVTGMEALLRWQHPELGLVSPADFIPVAEETGLIVPIGEWVLREACAQLKAWHKMGLPRLPVAVNLSAHQFMQGNLVQTVIEILKQNQLSPIHLEFELTESVLMQQSAETIALLQELRNMGIGLSLDDFGTGYSSLSYLKRFPIDCLKIDRSFIKDIPGDPGDVAITQAIIAMAHSLGLRVVAEGIEDDAQADFLRVHGCDEVQGFLFARPMPASAVSAWLHSRLPGSKPAQTG